MENDNILNILGHTVEITISGSGSLDPWTAEYANSIGLNLMCTSDMANFILVDGEKIYRLERLGVIKAISELKEVTDLDAWLSDPRNVRDFGTLEEQKKSCDKMKAESDRFKSLSKEEQEKEIAEWRRKREENRKKYQEAHKK